MCVFVDEQNEKDDAFFAVRLCFINKNIQQKSIFFFSPNLPRPKWSVAIHLVIHFFFFFSLILLSKQFFGVKN